MDNNIVGERIRESRKAKGFTQRELALLLNTSHATLSRWEAGYVEKMSIDTIKMMADLLGVDPLWLSNLDEGNNETEDVMNAISSEAHFMASIMDACERYGDIGKNFTDDDWREIVAYIKMKASIRDA